MTPAQHRAQAKHELAEHHELLAPDDRAARRRRRGKAAAAAGTHMTRILVCGGRDYDDRTAVYASLDSLHAEFGFTAVIAGGARGADTLAAEWARDRGIPAEVYMAEWERLGRKAGPIRNQRMLEEGKPDVVVAFPGGRGTTANMVAQARAVGLRVFTWS